MAQRVGAFRVFRVAHQTVRPFIHLTHGRTFAFAPSTGGCDAQTDDRFSGLELKMLAGVILRRFKRLGENLQRKGIRVVGKAVNCLSSPGMLL